MVKVVKPRGACRFPGSHLQQAAEEEHTRSEEEHTRSEEEHASWEPQNKSPDQGGRTWLPLSSSTANRLNSDEIMKMCIFILLRRRQTSSASSCQMLETPSDS